MAFGNVFPASPYVVRSRRSIQEACTARRRWTPGPQAAAAQECEACLLRTLCNPVFPMDQAAAQADI